MNIHIIRKKDFKNNNNNLVRSCIAANSINRRNLWLVTDILTLKSSFELCSERGLMHKDITNTEDAIELYNK